MFAGAYFLACSHFTFFFPLCNMPKKGKIHLTVVFSAIEFYGALFGQQTFYTHVFLNKIKCSGGSGNNNGTTHDKVAPWEILNASNMQNRIGLQFKLFPSHFHSFQLFIHVGINEMVKSSCIH